MLRVFELQELLSSSKLSRAYKSFVLIIITLMVDDKFTKIRHDIRTYSLRRAYMRIYLVQHGRAKSKDVDPDRHLTEKGLGDVEKMSAFLKDAKLQADVIWHSGKARAAQTAEILAKSVLAEQGIMQHDGLAPNDDVKPVKEKLMQREKDIMIVGHLPFLSKLASSLVTDNESANVIAFQQGGVVCLEKHENDVWSIKWIVVPELIS